MYRLQQACTESQSEGTSSTGRDSLVIIWLVVNLVNLLQSFGFVSRVWNQDGQRVAGAIITLLALPAAGALRTMIRRRSGWRVQLGPTLFILFVGLHVCIEYLLRVEFRSPARNEILVPYVTLFFGSILFMGVPMFRVDRRKWFVTAVTTAVLLGAMLFAMAKGVG